MKNWPIIFAPVFILILIWANGCTQDTSTGITETPVEEISQKICGNELCEEGENYSSCPQDCKIKEIERIAEEYHKTHTYSLEDFYVCSDMAMDVWNMLKTQGIDAEICAGNVKEDVYIAYADKTKDGWEQTYNFFKNMNHAWVLAEVKPSKYIAVETTGGFLVWKQPDDPISEEFNNSLYYAHANLCFDSPSDFKQFSDTREDLIAVCSETYERAIYWDENYAGKIVTPEGYEFKGVLEQKIQECSYITDKMSVLIEN